jgi:hypothetical protein
MVTPKISNPRYIVSDARTGEVLGIHGIEDLKSLLHMGQKISWQRHMKPVPQNKELGGVFVG